jgi:transcriptional regulator with XRE-family HTH domain
MTTRRANGATIRALREAIGIQQDTLAAAAGISKGHLSNIESERKQPAPAVLRAIANRLGVPLDAISYLVPEGWPLTHDEQVPA